MLVLYVLRSYFEDVVGFVAIVALGEIVDKRVIFIDNHAEAVFFLLVCTLIGFLEARFEYEQFELFLIFAVRVVLKCVLCHNYSRLVVIAHKVAEIVVEGGIFEFLLHEFVLKFEDGVLRYRHLIALGEEFEEVLQLFDSFHRAGLVELSLGRVEVIAIAAIEACKFGIFAFRVMLIISSAV